MKTTTKDMTSGSIMKHLVLFALPLFLGNIFQLLYNTVDTIVVGKFIGTQALAAVGSTSLIVNLVVFFFNGFSVGAGVIISKRFGAKDPEAVHIAVETTMTLTFVISVLMTLACVLSVNWMLHLMATPEDVFDQAATYLRIYVAGISGLLVYNIGSGILRAVGDTKRPLYFLILTSVLNIALDLFFVLVVHIGIAGVALATIISQFVSAALVLLLLTRTRDIYRFVWHDMQIDVPTMKGIFSLGLPSAFQSTLTSLSNVFVQSYINAFGSTVMASWSCYNKLDSYVFVPMKTFADASTTFVSQNMGAGDEARAHKGTFRSLLLAVSSTFLLCVLVFVCAAPVTRLFSSDPAVVKYSALFIHVNIFFTLFSACNQVLAGSLRGRGDARGPMIIMLSGFVVVRQIYLFIMTHFILNTEITVGLGYPVGWAVTATGEILYYYFRYLRPFRKAQKEQV